MAGRSQELPDDPLVVWGAGRRRALLGGELATARKWVITPVINGIGRVNPLQSLGWTNPLTSRGMSHQVVTDHSAGKRRRYRQPSPDSPFSRCIPWRTLEYDSKSRTRRLILRYPLVNKHSNGKSWKITIFNGKIHYKWQFSIAMFVYQRVLSKWSPFFGLFCILEYPIYEKWMESGLTHQFFLYLTSYVSPFVNYIYIHVLS